MKTRHALYIDALGDENKQLNYYYILFLPIKNYYSVCDTTSKLQSLGLMTPKVASKNKICYNIICIYIYVVHIYTVYTTHACTEILSFPFTVAGRRNYINIMNSSRHLCY